ncbi:MAG: hypothetical protein AB9897_01475 [Anaerolineaceae bacterium]
MNPFQSIRQLTYPKEFRIKAAEYPPELPAALELLINEISKPAQPAQENVNIGMITDIGTGLWRLRQKMLQPGTDQPLDEMRRAYRHLESTLDAMTNAEIKIVDHTGELVPEGGGLKLKVLAYQPLTGISHRMVQETIKPSIFYKGQMIQMGEVIVSIPDEEKANG